MNIFDKLQDVAFNVVTTVMGYTATWSPSTGGPTLSGDVLYNNPTEGRKLSEVDYSPNEYRMEYRNDLFLGLKAAADENRDEQVIIFSKYYPLGQAFNVLAVDAKYDGNTMIAKILPV